jgi:protein-S-isoprenylcysteine O-methyltransferase Ste14
VFFPAMNPWFAKASIIVGTLAIIIIPASLHHRGGEIKMVRSRKGPLELVLLTLTSLGFFLPLVWIATPVLLFADYPLRPVLFITGILCLALGLWLHYRSHADLGTNWSITLALQEKHQLVTHGIYGHVRHPMYLALLLYSSGQALLLPNWVAGPSYLVACAILVALRVGPEERMMLEEFGKDYETYMARTHRLFPGLR